MRLTTALRWTAVGCFAALVVAYFAAGLVPSAALRSEALVGGATILTAFALGALACATTLERGRLIALMRSGIVAAALAGVGWCGYLALEPALAPRPEGLWLATVVPLTCWSGFCTVAALAFQRRQSNAAGRWVARGTLAAAAALAAAVTLAYWLRTELEPVDEAVGRGIAALVVLVLLGLLLATILGRLAQLQGAGEEEQHVKLDFTAVCPRCGVRQDLVTGGDACRRCGLRIKVVVP